MGLEPTTPWLEVRCAIHCATRSANHTHAHTHKHKQNTYTCTTNMHTTTKQLTFTRYTHCTHNNSQKLTHNVALQHFTYAKRTPNTRKHDIPLGMHIHAYSDKRTLYNTLLAHTRRWPIYAPIDMPNITSYSSVWPRSSLQTTTHTRKRPMCTCVRDDWPSLTSNLLTAI